MGLDNDTRGWIMTAISGVACIAGASIICVDAIVRLYPGMHDFKISESDAFLSASLSLSFGVMLFSSLYSMLPQSKNYLQDGGYSPRAASFLMIGLFLAGVLGIRILSRVIHRFIPSHIVDCDHNHDEESGKKHLEEMEESRQNEHEEHQHSTPNISGLSDHESSTENTPLLPQTQNTSYPRAPRRTMTAPTGEATRESQVKTLVAPPSNRRSSSNLTLSITTLTKYVSNNKDECDAEGPCMGFSHPCGHDCFKVVQRRGTAHRTPTWQRVSSDFGLTPTVPEEDGPSSDTEIGLGSPQINNQLGQMTEEHSHKSHAHSRAERNHLHHSDHEHDLHRQQSRRQSTQSHTHEPHTDHHHHVPTNAFMAIGLQTSLAIALHKAPEGFITYATNHANPTLGFAVFMALFIHNISEGFAMSLPLFLALNSRWKAILWSSLLGGVSQPLGAGVAALWFKLSADGGHLAPDESVYGGMFAITAGIMTSVALSLFAESLQLSHNKGNCIVFAFLGMALLGLSSALTAK